MANNTAHVAAEPGSRDADVASVTVTGRGPGPAPLAAGAATAVAPPPSRPGAALGGVPVAAPPPWTFGGAEPTARPEPPRSAAEQPPPPPPALPRRPASPPAAAPLAPPAPSLGPVGKSRPALLVPALAVVTLGVSALVWHHRVNQEMEHFDPRLHARPARSATAVVIPWLLGLLVSIAGGALIVVTTQRIGIPFDPGIALDQQWWPLAGLAAVPYLTIALPFSAVAVVMTAERLRCVEEHVGVPAHAQVRPVRLSLLLLVPVVGGLVLIGREQARLNALWAGTVRPGARS